jgi:hypothetical protein
MKIAVSPARLRYQGNTGDQRLDKWPEIREQLRWSSPGRPLGSGAETQVADLEVVGEGVSQDLAGRTA